MSGYYRRTCALIFSVGTQRCFLFAVLLALISSDVSAENSNDNADNQDTDPVFIPPAIGAPKERLGAGTRDAPIQTDGPLHLLIPPGGGLTSIASPPLAWRLKTGFQGTMQAQIALSDGSGVQIVREGVFPPGYYALDLERSDFELEFGQTYNVSIALISKGARVAQVDSAVERVTTPEGDPGLAGIWFDALAPLVSVDLSGQARVTDHERLDILLKAGGVDQ